MFDSTITERNALFHSASDLILARRLLGRLNVVVPVSLWQH